MRRWALTLRAFPGRVVAQVSRPINAIEMTPDSARSLAAKLLLLAEAADNELIEQSENQETR